MYSFFISIFILSLIFLRGLFKRASTILLQLQIQKGAHHRYTVRYILVALLYKLKVSRLRARFYNKYTQLDNGVVLEKHDPYCQHDEVVHQWVRAPVAMETATANTPTVLSMPCPPHGFLPRVSLSDSSSSNQHLNREVSRRGFIAKVRPSAYEFTTFGRKRLKRIAFENSLNAFGINKLPIRSIYMRLPTANAVYLHVADHTLHMPDTSFSGVGQRHAYGQAIPP